MPIEQNSAELERIVSADAEVEQLADGLAADRWPAEGPLWWKEGGYLLFSDIGQDRRMKWAPGEGATVFQQGTNQANGLTRDLQGRLIACEHGARRVTRQEHDGSITVIANNHRGARFNRPNDAVVKSDGCIYFSDPGAPDAGLDLDFSGVYRVTPDLGTQTLLIGDFIVPNGLAFSPDESSLYINDTRRRHIRAFDMQPNGMLALATDRVFCDLSGDRPGVPDGMKVDVEGNVYCGGSGGIWVMDPTGKHLGTVVHGEDTTTNMAWGGDDWTTLFYTTWRTMGRIQMKIPGIPVPVSN
ncbi:MAG: SMP-30/gluconolactonase/LRE family protein [Chloroflexi bacterium]|nr:SMP-30/gluconolactonase/LRE family protein [Chloroflexota bacterium]